MAFGDYRMSVSESLADKLAKRVERGLYVEFSKEEQALLDRCSNANKPLKPQPREYTPSELHSPPVGCCFGSGDASAYDS